MHGTEKGIEAFKKPAMETLERHESTQILAAQ
jgi:hypothetical protein